MRQTEVMKLSSLSRSSLPALLTVAVIVALGGAIDCDAQSLGSTFSYQGRLEESGDLANGLFDFRMVAFDSLEFGNQVSAILLFEDVEVLEGLVNLEVDFGFDVFAGDRRWVQIEVREGASVGGYTPLTPRQEILPSPYSLYSLQAQESENASAVGGQALESGTIGDCLSDGSAGSTGSVAFSDAFSSPPRVFLTPDESFQNSSCVTARVDSRSTTGFDWTSFNTDAPQACDCVHWLAVGER